MVKFKNNILGIAAAMIAAGSLASCSNALDGPNMGGNGSTVLTSPTLTPDLVTWSGNETFTNTFKGTRSYATQAEVTFTGNANNGQDVGQGQTNPLWAPFENPTLVQEGEKEKVLEAIAAKTKNGTIGYIHEEIVFPWENYFLQDVLRGVDSNCPSNSWYLYAYTANSDNDFANVTNSGQIDNHAVFMNGTNQVRANNTALMVNMKPGSYDEMNGRQFYFHMNCHENQDWFDSYIVVKVDGYYYICVDFACVHQENDNGNEKRWHDWDYNDWIIKITPAIPVDKPNYEVPEVWTSSSDSNNDDNGNNGGNPGNGDNGGNDNNGGNPGNGGNDNNDNNNNNGSNNGTNGDNNKYNTREVEINLALNDIHYLPNGSQKYDIADLVSKLSIHVRYPKDVEVILPVPEKFYCDQDDLFILTDHSDFEYGGESVEYQNIVGENTVTLTVEFVSAKDDKLTGTQQGYIRVYTQGINDEVIKYCRENYGDGINFEVYNYYNRGTKYTTGYFEEISYDELQWKYLSRSFVNFDWTVRDYASKDYPDFYINAFNQIGGNVNQGDCYVWIMGDHRAKYNSSIYEGGLYNGTAMNWSSESNNSNNVEKNYFWNAYQGTHLNGSPLNWIYTAKSVIGSTDPSGSVAMPNGNNWPFANSYQIQH